MRKAKHRRPEVESLESLTLLSGIAAARAPVVPLPSSVHLVGTVHGSFTPKGVGGGSITNASGTLSPLGKVSFAATVSRGTLTGSPGNLTITNAKGKLVINLNLTPNGQGLSGAYMINGATSTKVYAGDMGSGAIAVTLAGKKFTATFS